MQDFDLQDEIRPAISAVFEHLAPLRAASDLVLVAIDGHSGAGKSSLAASMAAVDNAVEVIHGDLFYKPESQRPWPPADGEPAGHEFELDRLEREVVAPLARAEVGEYTPRDFETGIELAGRSLPSHGVVVIEGIYAMVEQLRHHYDHTIWIDCPVDICLHRVLARDGGAHRRDKFVDVWFPQEERYIEEQGPHLVADQIISTDRRAKGR